MRKHFLNHFTNRKTLLNVCRFDCRHEKSRYWEQHRLDISIS